MAITQGFGITETGFIPTNALETEVKVISNEECYDSLKTGIVYRLHSKTLAAIWLWHIWFLSGWSFGVWCILLCPNDP